MALANFGLCDPAPGVSISLDYDDVTLAISAIRFQNLSNRDAQITVTIGSTPHVDVLPSLTPLRTRDISARGWSLVATMPPKGSPSVGLPANVNVQCTWPV